MLSFSIMLTQPPKSGAMALAGCLLWAEKLGRRGITQRGLLRAFLRKTSIQAEPVQRLQTLLGRQFASSDDEVRGARWFVWIANTRKCGNQTLLSFTI